MAKIKNIKINVSQEVLNSVYKECDKYDNDETGGRLIGFYSTKGKNIEINVVGEIGPGPNAHRSRTSFFQDGDFQYEIFRSLEERHPSLEHLGNWHTHHVNGYPHLSQGDLETYQKIVNNENHNTSFLYIMLVVSKNHGINKVPYTIKHFLFFRNTESFIEIPESDITVTHEQPIWVGEKNEIGKKTESKSGVEITQRNNLVRFYDQINIVKLFPRIKPFYSEQQGGLYWKGKFQSGNNEMVDILILENSSDEKLVYSIELLKGDLVDKKFTERYNNLYFDSATQALVSVERDLYEIEKS